MSKQYKGYTNIKKMINKVQLLIEPIEEFSSN